MIKLKPLVNGIGRFHGRSSYIWNREDDSRGRGVCYRCFDRAMRNDQHYWATINYVNHDPVQHGLVENWTDWAWSSAVDCQEKAGRETARSRWKAYPILEYGKGWDDFSF